MYMQMPDGYDVVSPAEQRRRAMELRAKFAPKKPAKVVVLRVVELAVPPLSYDELVALANPARPGDPVAMPPKATTVRVIITYVMRTYSISRGDLLSDRRKHSFVWPRHVTAFLLNHFTALSLPRIGRALGGRDHTTILHAHRNVKRKMDEDPAIRAEVEGHVKALADVLEGGQ
jgi:hypothetical protein